MTIADQKKGPEIEGEIWKIADKVEERIQEVTARFEEKNHVCTRVMSSIWVLSRW